MIPTMFVLFSLGGAVFGMGEEAIAFAMVIVPVLIALGYDSIAGVLVTFGATQIGFATSWMNPFSVGIAQGIAEVPVMSGAAFRVVMWAGFTALGLVYTWLYARRIKKTPERSLGRNDPCWCGSGKKYKQCHMRQDIEARRGQAPAAPTPSAPRRKQQRVR